MALIIGILLILIGIITVYFNIQYSPTKKHFYNDVEATKKENIITSDGIFNKNDFANFPEIIQKYINHCGYIGSPKMSYMKMNYHDVTFMQGKTGPSLTIDYTQYNFVNVPSRLALIDSSMFGIPFEGYDYYSNGKGSMKGIIAKNIYLFNQTGAEMDKACLVTFLAECLFEPTTLLQDYITFEEINEYQVRATISYYDIIVSGIFTFNELGEMISFTTNDRCVVGTDGTKEYIKWSALCKDYKVAENGIKYPTLFQAVWNYDDGDFIYFDGKISSISYN